MFTKFGHHLSNVLEAIGTKVKTLVVMVFLVPSQFCACPEKKQEHPWKS